MKLTHLIAAAVAAVCLSLPVQAASAGSVVQEGAALKGQSVSAVTLVGGGPKGPGSWSGSKGPGSWSGSKWSGSKGPGSKWSGSKGPGYKWSGKGVPHGARWGWRGGRRGYWYGGVWYWWGPVGVYGGSCYWNCINAGFGPGYCSAYSFNFCY
ncbi:MAG: hypothetical protein ACLP7P_20685 [Rhodomicrobium sp.]